MAMFTRLKIHHERSMNQLSLHYYQPISEQSFEMMTRTVSCTENQDHASPDPKPKQSDQPDQPTQKTEDKSPSKWGK